MTISLKSRHLVLPGGSTDVLRQGVINLGNEVERLLDYPSSKGDDNLRQDLKKITPNWSGDVLVTGSATQALSLALSLIGKGKTIALHVPAYFSIIQQAKELKQNILAWETIDELEKLGKVDAIITTSNHTPPASISLSMTEKQRIADISKKHNAWVIEDNAYEPLWFNQDPLPIPVDADRSIRIGSLSKIAGPALRLGFIRASDEILELIRQKKITNELSTSLAPQIIVRPSLTTSNLDNMRRTLHQRADHLREGLEHHTKVPIPKPDGGSYLRLDLPANCDPHTLAQVAEKKGLLIDTNKDQYPDEVVRPWLRLHCGAIATENIPEAADILHRSIEELR